MGADFVDNAQSHKFSKLGSGAASARLYKCRQGKASSPQPQSLIPPHLNPAFINRPCTSDAVPIGAVHGIQHANGREAVESVANSRNDVMFQLLMTFSPVECCDGDGTKEVDMSLFMDGGRPSLPPDFLLRAHEPATCLHGWFLKCTTAAPSATNSKARTLGQCAVTTAALTCKGER